VKVPIVGLDRIDDYLYHHDNLLTFTYQPSTQSEDFTKNQLKEIVSSVHAANKDVNFALIKGGDDVISTQYTYGHFDLITLGDKKQVKEIPDHDGFERFTRDYDSAKVTPTELMRWVTSKMSGSYSDKISCDSLDTTLSKNAFNSIYFGPEEGSVWESYKDVAKDMPHSSYHSDEVCAGKYGVKAPGVAVVRQQGKSPLAWSGYDEKEDHEGSHLQQFLEFESTPLFIKTKAQFEHVHRNNRFVLALCSKDAEKDKEVRDVFKAFATEDKRDKMFFVCPSFCASGLLPLIDSTHTSDLMVVIASHHDEAFRMD